MPMNSLAAANRDVRRLGVDDVETVIAIDRAHAGRARGHFFEKLFAAAKARPDDFICIGIHQAGALRGFAIARILRGEFGRKNTVAVLNAVGVEPQSRERGIGHALMGALIETLRAMGVGSLQSQADWTSHDILHFFDTSGFTLAPQLALERSAVEPLQETSEEI
jgi:N-acetylglutamate synthase-like GNAT family acetyltransferase